MRRRRWPTGHNLLGGRRMQRWTTMIGVLLMVLMLWTGATGHAAEVVECSPVTMDSPAHFDGGSETPPSERGSDAVHHHMGCSGHHLAASSETRPMPFPVASSSVSLDRTTFWHPGDEPSLTLRPPIA